MRFRRRSARGPREPLYWERVCGGSWGYVLDSASSTIDCESSEVLSGLVLATGAQNAFGSTADQQTTVRKIIWPTFVGGLAGTAAAKPWVGCIVVIKTGKDLSVLLGASLSSILDTEDVLDVRAFGKSEFSTSVVSVDQDLNLQPDETRRWEINVARKLQTTENIVALAFTASFPVGLAAANTVTILHETPVISVLLQRTMRKR